MSDPRDLRKKPSVQSLDSGYASFYSLDQVAQTELEPIASPIHQSTDRSSTKGLDLQQDENGDITLSSEFWNFHAVNQEQTVNRRPATEPVVSKLNIYTANHCTEADSGLLDPLLFEDKLCLECELWNITNPGERCEQCRIPEITLTPTLSFPYKKEKEFDVLLDQVKEIQGGRPAVPKLETRCSACELAAQIDPSSKCKSCAPPDLLSPVSPVSSGSPKVRRSRAGRNSKLPLAALNRLQEWLNAHQDDPYPSAEVKRQLAQECRITEKQVTTWFTNARARQLNPMENWLSSGSEDECAQESDIASAAQDQEYVAGFARLPERPTYRRAGSVSNSSIFSRDANKPASSRRGKKKNYRRRGKQPPRIAEQSTSPVNPNQKMQDTWQCTFCLQHLVPKSWRRHEETQHRPRAQWTCMLFGPRLSLPQRGGSCCAFCMMNDPPEDHFLREHRITECAKRATGDRTFFRPDHLRQHVKNFHGSKLLDIAQARWKTPAEAGATGWTCGFCGDRLHTWDQRQTHIANHFKDGMTMDQWRKYPEPGSGEDMDLSGAYISGTTSTAPQIQSPYNMLPTTSIASSTSFYHPVTGAQVLPDINMDPIMDASTTFLGWQQSIDTQFPVLDNQSYVSNIPSDFDSSLEDVLYGNMQLQNNTSSWNPQL